MRIPSAYLCLTKLDLSRCGLQRIDKLLLPQLGALTDLNLASNNLREREAISIFRYLTARNCHVRKINLSDNSIDADRDDLVDNPEIKEFTRNLAKELNECQVYFDSNVIEQGIKFDSPEIHVDSVGIPIPTRKIHPAVKLGKTTLIFSKHDGKEEYLFISQKMKQNNARSILHRPHLGFFSDEDFKVTNGDWIVALVCKGIHAAIYLEGIEHGQKFLKRYHLTGDNNGGSTKIKPTISIEDRRCELIGGSSDVWQTHVTRRETQPITRSQGVKLDHTIKESKKRMESMEVDFDMVLPGLFKNKDKSYNCVKWALEMLQSIGIRWAEDVSTWSTPNQAVKRASKNKRSTCFIV